jgi:LysR family glycine cleavage system transcriptional activator
VARRSCAWRTPPTNGRCGSRPRAFPECARGPEFEYYGQALQAAADGVGVAIGMSPYINDDLDAGRLVAPFDLSMSKDEHWYLIWRDSRGEEPAFRVFWTWILGAAGA